MGLGAFKWYWQRQTQDFGHEEGSKYSCLVFDNRGMGESDKPILRYSTSEMAKDTVELLEYLDWMGKRGVHVIGISMGGMIAQELVSRLSQADASCSAHCLGLSRARLYSVTLSGINGSTTY